MKIKSYCTRMWMWRHQTTATSSVWWQQLTWSQLNSFCSLWFRQRGKEREQGQRVGKRGQDHRGECAFYRKWVSAEDGEEQRKGRRRNSFVSERELVGETLRKNRFWGNSRGKVKPYMPNQRQRKRKQFINVRTSIGVLILKCQSINTELLSMIKFIAELRLLGFVSELSANIN